MLYVGDLPIDHQAATAAGASCVCVTTGYASRADLETAGVVHVFDELTEVAAHVLNGYQPPSTLHRLSDPSP
jgi:phosphoglycolate phosphatase-like HAD superfamily hydrolase